VNIAGAEFCTSDFQECQKAGAVFPPAVFLVIFKNGVK